MLQRFPPIFAARSLRWPRGQSADPTPAVERPALPRLPLALAAEPSRWRQEPLQIEEGVAAQVFGRDGHACRFCGFQAEGHQEVVRIDAGQGHPALADLATACPPLPRLPSSRP